LKATTRDLQDRFENPSCDEQIVWNLF